MRYRYSDGIPPDIDRDTDGGFLWESGGSAMRQVSRAFMAMGVASSPQAAAISPDVIGVTVSTRGTTGCFAYCFRREAGPLLILALFSICQYLSYVTPWRSETLGVVDD